jgi:hypothetical protein
VDGALVVRRTRAELDRYQELLPLFGRAVGADTDSPGAMITPLKMRRSSKPQKRKPGLLCSAPWPNHSITMAAGSTALPSITCERRHGVVSKSSSRSNTRGSSGGKLIAANAGAMGVAEAATASGSTEPSPKTTISTGPGSVASSRSRYFAPAARPMTSIPSAANSLRSAGVTMPPSHGPQLMDNTLQSLRALDSRCATLLRISLPIA